MRVHGQRGAPDWASAAKATSSFFRLLWDSICRAPEAPSEDLVLSRRQNILARTRVHVASAAAAAALAWARANFVLCGAKGGREKA